MSLAVFTIEFDNPFATYYSGQHVTGRVFIRLSKPKKLQGIEINFLGRTSVYWNVEEAVDRDGKSKKETVHYSCHETYFESTCFVFGGPHGKTTLSRGEHFFPFQLILPHAIPSSFEGKFGHVRYTVKGKILRPWRFDHECKMAFTVLNPLDLNLETNIQAPVQRTEEKTLCCCCCRSLPITLVLSMPFTGFVPGQVCSAVVEVDNPTERNVAVECALVQDVTFNAYCGSSAQERHESKVVARQRLEKIVMKRSSMTSPLSLKIPALPTSYLRNCNCISISYKLLITGSVSGLANINIQEPVVIGTIPMRTQIHSIRLDPTHASESSLQPSQKKASAAAEGATDPSAPPDPFSSYPDLPPPSYEEYVSGKANIRSEGDSQYLQGNMDFAPRYPTYHFN